MNAIVKNENHSVILEKKTPYRPPQPGSTKEDASVKSSRLKYLIPFAMISWSICMYFAYHLMQTEKQELQDHLKIVAEKPLVFEGVTSKNLTVRYIETAHLKEDGTYTQDFYGKTTTPYGETFEIAPNYVNTSKLKVIDEDVQITPRKVTDSKRKLFTN